MADNDFEMHLNLTVDADMAKLVSDFTKLRSISAEFVGQLHLLGISAKETAKKFAEIKTAIQPLKDILSTTQAKTLELANAAKAVGSREAVLEIGKQFEVMSNKATKSVDNTLAAIKKLAQQRGYSEVLSAVENMSRQIKASIIDDLKKPFEDLTTDLQVQLPATKGATKVPISPNSEGLRKIAAGVEALDINLGPKFIYKRDLTTGVELKSQEKQFVDFADTLTLSSNILNKLYNQLINTKQKVKKLETAKEELEEAITKLESQGNLTASQKGQVTKKRQLLAVDINAIKDLEAEQATYEKKMELVRANRDKVFALKDEIDKVNKIPDAVYKSAGIKRARVGIDWETSLREELAKVGWGQEEINKYWQEVLEIQKKAAEANTVLAEMGEEYDVVQHPKHRTVQYRIPGNEQKPFRDILHPKDESSEPPIEEDLKAAYAKLLSGNKLAGSEILAKISTELDNVIKEFEKEIDNANALLDTEDLKLDAPYVKALEKNKATLTIVKENLRKQFDDIIKVYKEMPDTGKISSVAAKPVRSAISTFKLEAKNVEKLTETEPGTSEIAIKGTHKVKYMLSAKTPEEQAMAEEELNKEISDYQTESKAQINRVYEELIEKDKDLISAVRKKLTNVGVPEKITIDLETAKFEFNVLKQQGIIETKIDITDFEKRAAELKNRLANFEKGNKKLEEQEKEIRERIKANKGKATELLPIMKQKSALTELLKQLVDQIEDPEMVKSFASYLNKITKMEKLGAALTEKQRAYTKYNNEVKKKILEALHEKASGVMGWESVEASSANTGEGQPATKPKEVKQPIIPKIVIKKDPNIAKNVEENNAKIAEEIKAKKPKEVKQPIIPKIVIKKDPNIAKNVEENNAKIAEEINKNKSETKVAKVSPTETKNEGAESVLSHADNYIGLRTIITGLLLEFPKAEKLINRISTALVGLFATSKISLSSFTLLNTKLLGFNADLETSKKIVDDVSGALDNMTPATNFEELKGKLDEAETKLKGMVTGTQEVAASFGAYKAEAKAAAAEQKRVAKEQVDAVNNVKDQVTKADGAIINETNRLSNSFIKSQESINSMKSRLDSLAKLKPLAGSIQSFKDFYDSLNELSNSVSKGINLGQSPSSENLQSMLDISKTISPEIANLSNKFRDVRTEVTVTSNEMGKIDSSIGKALGHAGSDIDTTINRLTRLSNVPNSRLSSSFNDLNTRAQENKKVIEELKKQYQELQAQLGNAKNGGMNVEDIKNQMVDLADKINGAKKETKDINSEMGKLNRSDMLGGLTDVLKQTTAALGAFAGEIAYHLGVAIREAYEAEKSLIIGQASLTNSFNVTSDSSYQFARQIEYLSGEALPLVSQEIFKASEYFNNYADAMLSVKAASIIAATGVADFSTILRNLGAASEGTLSPILGKFFGRQIGINMKDANGQSITFAALMDRIAAKYESLNGILASTPWWTFRELALQGKDLARTLVTMPMAQFAEGLKPIVQSLYNFNSFLTMADDKVSTFNKIEMVANGTLITAKQHTSELNSQLVALSNTINKLTGLEALPDTAKTTNEIKKSNTQIAQQLGLRTVSKAMIQDETGSWVDLTEQQKVALAAGNKDIANKTSVRTLLLDIKDNAGRFLDISEASASDWTRLKTSMDKTGESANNLVSKVMELNKQADSTKEGLLTLAVSILPLLTNGLGTIFAGIPGLGSLANIFNAPMAALQKFKTMSTGLISRIFETPASGLSLFQKVLTAGPKLISGAIKIPFELPQIGARIAQSTSGIRDFFSNIFKIGAGSLTGLASHFSGVFSGIKNIIGTVFCGRSGTDFISKISADIGGLMPKLGSGFKSFFAPLLSAAQNITGPLKNILSFHNITGSLGNIVSSTFHNVTEGLGTIFGRLEPIFGKLSGILGKLGGAFGGLVTGIAPVIATIGGAILAMIAAAVIFDTIKNNAKELGAALKWLSVPVGNVIEAFKDLMSSMKKVGAESGIVEFLKGIIHAVGGFINIFAGIIEFIAGNSKKAKEKIKIGMLQLAYGFAEGLEGLTKIPIFGILAQVGISMIKMFQPIINIIHGVSDIFHSTWKEAGHEFGQAFINYALIIAGLIQNTPLSSIYKGIVDFFAKMVEYILIELEKVKGVFKKAKGAFVTGWEWLKQGFDTTDKPKKTFGELLKENYANIDTETDSAIADIKTASAKNIVAIDEFLTKPQDIIADWAQKHGYTTQITEKLTTQVTDLADSLHVDLKTLFEGVDEGVIGGVTDLFGKTTTGLVNEVAVDTNSLLGEFNDKMSELTMNKWDLALYNVSKEIAKYTPLIQQGLISPVQMATMAMKELSKAAFDSLHATLYGIQENRATEQFTNLANQANKVVTSKHEIDIIYKDLSSQQQGKGGTLTPEQIAYVKAILLPALTKSLSGTGTSSTSVSIGTTTFGSP